MPVVLGPDRVADAVALAVADALADVDALTVALCVARDGVAELRVVLMVRDAVRAVCVCDTVPADTLFVTECECVRLGVAVLVALADVNALTVALCDGVRVALRDTLALVLCDDEAVTVTSDTVAELRVVLMVRDVEVVPESVCME